MHRKILGLAGAMVILSALPAVAGSPGISGFGGYQFGGKVPTTAGDLDFKDEWSYGVALEVPVNVKPGSALLLFWSQQPTTIRLDDWRTGIRRTITDVNVNYFQAGAQYSIPKDEKLEPFTLATLGVVWIDPSEPSYSSITKFAFTLGGGLKYWANPKVAIRLQFNLYMSILNGGVWAGWGTGGGSLGVSGTGFAQGAILGGLTFKLGGS